MTQAFNSVGIIGGSGMLGTALSIGFVRRGAVRAQDFWVSNRTGRAPDIGRGSVNVASSNQALVDTCDVIVLSVPPDMAAKLDIQAAGKLVISVMAGVNLQQLSQITGSPRVVRAMSSPAAAQGLAFSPWIAAPGVTTDDKVWVSQLLGACGVADEIHTEDHINHFTAMTGPVPGFVAHFAKSMIDYACAAGIAPDVADRAVRQLFLAGGTMMAQGPSPAEHVREMIDYAGTTAAGLVTLRDGCLDAALAQALDAALEKARALG